MKNKIFGALALALTVAAGAAHADTTRLGSGAGDYSFEGTHDASFYVGLTQGDYLVSGDIAAELFTFNNVWLSSSGDANFDLSGNDFLSLTPQLDAHGAATSNYVLHVTDDKMKLFINVDTNWAKKTGGAFTGELHITSIPAVPEPATSALLLAGLGMMAFVGRRRRG